MISKGLAQRMSMRCSMKVGDLVKSIYGTLFGEGLVINIIDGPCMEDYAELLWNCHGNITIQTVPTKRFKVIA